MPGLDKPDFFIGTIERAEDPVNAIAGISKHVLDAPAVQTLNEEIAYGLGHRKLSANHGVQFKTAAERRSSYLAAI